MNTASLVNINSVNSKIHFPYKKSLLELVLIIHFKPWLTQLWDPSRGLAGFLL